MKKTLKAAAVALLGLLTAGYGAVMLVMMLGWATLINPDVKGLAYWGEYFRNLFAFENLVPLVVFLAITAVGAGAVFRAIRWIWPAASASHWNRPGMPRSLTTSAIVLMPAALTVGVLVFLGSAASH